jgi:hypothetical protein
MTSAAPYAAGIDVGSHGVRADGIIKAIIHP